MLGDMFVPILRPTGKSNFGIVSGDPTRAKSARRRNGRSPARQSRCLTLEALEQRMLLTVPFFSQRDSRWSGDPIIDVNGVNQGTVGSRGCAMTATAMLTDYYGQPTDPGLLNTWLNANGGYASGGLLIWSKPAAYSGGKMEYRADLGWTSTNPTTDNDHWTDLKAQLDQGYPVIVKVDFYPSTATIDEHWVVVTEFLGGSITDPGNYRINDPWEPTYSTATTLAKYYDPIYDNTFFAARVYRGSPPAPEVIVLGHGLEITDADTSPRMEDGTDFGTVAQGGTSVSSTFTVRNDGDGSLSLGEVTVPTGFTVTDRLNSQLAPGQSDTFVVRLDTGVVGTKTGQVSFSTNDTTENPYNFTITGTVTSAGVPEVFVSGNAVEIVNGDTTPSAVDGTDFGSVVQNGSAVSHSFLVRNTGDATLNGLFPVTVPDGFTVTDPLNSQLDPGQQDTFVVRMDTATVGTKSGDVSFETNDSNENPYTFRISGTVAASGGGDGKIVFSSDRDGNSEIYVMNSDGSGQTRLTNNSASDTRPRYSPDGTKIVFVSNRNGIDEIFLMNADGTNVVRLTNNTDDSAPVFSADGTKIAFASYRDGGDYDIWLMNADGTNQVPLTNNLSNDRDPTFAPNGTIAFASNRDGTTYEIYRMNIDGSGQTRLTNNSATDAWPSFSPDGSKIAFESNRDGNYEIYVMNADGSSQTRLTSNAAEDRAATFNPDGSKIAFRTMRTANKEIFVMNADGTGPTQLTNNTAADTDPAWRPTAGPPPTVTLSVAPAAIAEASGSAILTATLSAVSGQTVTVVLGYSGTATGGGTDYTGSNTITIAAGNLTGTAPLAAVQDALDENNETITVDITGVTNGNESGTQRVTVTITDDDPPPTVTLSVTPSAIAEASGVATLTATLSAISGLPVTVDLSYSGSAIFGGMDYTAPASISIPAGSLTGSANLTAVQDALDEVDETVVVDINVVENGTESGAQQVTVTITDDDAAPTVSSVAATPTLVSDDDTGAGKLSVKVVFAQTMDTATDPSLVFDPDVTGGASPTLSNPSAGVWSQTNVANDTFTRTYDVADRNVSVAGVTIDVTGAKDAAGNLLQDYVPEAEFSIDTANPVAPEITGIATDSGSNPADGITNDTTLQIHGTAEALGQVRVFLDGSSIGLAQADATGNWSLDHTATPLAQGTYSLTAKVTDTAGNESPSSTAFTLKIDTQAPTTQIALAGGTYNADGWPDAFVGLGIDSSGSGVDKVELSIQSVTTSQYWGGAAFDQASELFLTATGTGSWLYLFPDTNFPADGQYRVHARSTDKAGNTDAGPSVTFSIDTTSPVVTVGLLTTNDTTPVLTGTVSEGTLTVTVNGKTYTAGDGNLTVSGTNWTLQIPAADALAQGTYVVTASATDAAGNTGTDGTTNELVIDTTPPVVTASVPSTAGPTDADSVTFSVSFDSWVSQVTTDDFQLTKTGTADGTIASVSAAAGTTFTVSVTNLVGDGTLRLDLKGGTDVQDAAGNGAGAYSGGGVVTLQNTALGVTLETTPSGFVAHFPQSLDASVLNLYDVQAAVYGAADFTVVGDQVGNVKGSLIYNEAARTATFIRTGGPLVGDTYTITLRSANNGFKYASGELIDGDGDGQPGGNFSVRRTAPTITSPVLSIPDISRGPDQTVNVPAAGTDIPVTLSDGTGIQGVSFAINFNPALLNITQVTRASGLPTDWQVLSEPDGPGRIKVLAYGIDSLPAGPIVLAQIQARVPAEAGYGLAQVIDLNDLQLNESPGGVADDGVQTVVYFGDATGNFNYGALDASYAARVAIGRDGGFQAYPMKDPVLIADISGNGSMGALDASYIAQKAIGRTVSEIPALPATVPPIQQGGIDPVVTLPTITGAHPGDVLTRPILVDDAGGLMALQFTIHYQTDLVDLAASDIVAGSVLSGWQFLKDVYEAEGRIEILAFGVDPLSAGAAELVQITCHIPATAAAGVSPLTLTGLLNEGELTMTPVAGSITVTGGGTPPTDIGLSASSVAENSATGTVVGSLTATDAESPTGPFTFALVAGTGDTDNGSFTLVGDRLKTAAVFNYESQSTYSVRVQVTDPDGMLYAKALTITVTDVNLPPTDIGLSQSIVAENLPVGTVVGTLSATDAEPPAAPFTFAFIAGAGDTDNTSFTIDGNQLKTATVFDYEVRSTYSIRVQVTDAGGLPYVEVLSITVTDVDEALPTSTITFPANGGSYNAISWSDAITVTATDPGGSGVASVGVSVLDSSSGKYWDGSAFAAAGETFLNAGFAADVWSLGLDHTRLAEGASYTVHARATDAAGNQQDPLSAASFDFVATLTGDVRVYIPRDLAGVAGGSLTIPVKVQITNPAGTEISGFDILIGYDAAKFTYVTAELGDMFAETDLRGSISEPTTGYLIYTADSFSGSPVFPVDTLGNLFTLTFTINAGTPDGPVPVNLLPDYNSTVMAMFDNGLDDVSIRPLPTGSPDDSIDGLVTIDNRPPLLVALSPLDNAINVAADADLSLTFDEPVQKGSGTVVVMKSSDHSVIETIDVGSPAVTIAGATVTIDRSVPLAELTEYYVQVSAGAFQDLVGNPFAGISDPTDWNFKTAGLMVIDLAPTATGFTALLNHPLVTAELNLYDGYPATLGPADVTLVGAATGAVRGSLVLSEGNQRITFIRTGGLRAEDTGLTAASAGLLPADTYTVTLVSGADAFQDVAGNLLDGNADGTPGDDYTNTFSVGTAPTNAVTVGLMDVVRGYGQPVNFPADNLAAGLPLAVSDGSLVSALSLTLRYDPALLTVQNFQLTTTVAARGVTAELDVSSPGAAMLTITAPVGVSLSAAAGVMTVGTFTARVPDTAAYAAKHLLDITELQVYDLGVPTRGVLPALDDDAIHVAAFFGDCNGSRTYNSPDTTLVRRLIGQLQNGLVAYQLADPVLLADITLNDAIQSADTTSVRRVIGQVPVANVPALPAGVTPPAATGADPKLYIPQDLSGAPGGAVAVPVKLEVTEPAGITLGGLQLVLEFDASRLTVSGAQLGALVAGSDLSGNWTQPAAGRLVYTADAFLGSTRLPAQTVGELLTVTFAIAPTAVGATVINLRASWGPTATALFDNDLQQLVLAPVPTDAATDAVDGLVTIGGRQNEVQPCDVNGDGQVTPLDALLVINHLSIEAAGGGPSSASASRYYDVNGDGEATPLDVREIVSYLNGQPSGMGEGEALWHGLLVGRAGIQGQPPENGEGEAGAVGRVVVPAVRTLAGRNGVAPAQQDLASLGDLDEALGIEEDESWFAAVPGEAEPSWAAHRAAVDAILGEGLWP